MENFQNITKNPAATYQLFVRKPLIKQGTDQKKGFPVLGCKMNIQQSPRLNNTIKFQIPIDKQQKIKSNSVKNDQCDGFRYISNRCQIYQNYMNYIIKKRNANLSFVETKSNKYNRNNDEQLNRSLLFQQQLVKEKINQRKYNIQKQIITEPSIIEDLKPWESYHNSIAYFQ